MKYVLTMCLTATLMVGGLGCQQQGTEEETGTEPGLQQPNLQQEEMQEGSAEEEQGADAGETAPGQPEAHAAVTETPESPTLQLAVLEERAVEAGCASCSYEMAGIMGCELAVNVDGKSYLVEAEGVDAHKAGLCDHTRPAVVSGKLNEEGVLVAKKFEFTDETEADDH